MCAGKQFLQVWARNGSPVGQNTFTLWVITAVPDRKSRTVHYEYLFTDFYKVGPTQTSGLKVDVDAEITTWPSTTNRNEGGQVPPTKSMP